MAIIETAAAPFSAALREAGRDAHQAAHDAPFMADLLGGRLGVDAYTRYAGQLWFVYRALEADTGTLAADPVAAPFLHPELARTAALEADLRHLAGPDWRDGLTPLPSTARYTARIAETAAHWPAGYLAHHYTRYLGDLSGGQVIRGLAARHWGLGGPDRTGDGVRFYVFDRIPNPAAFKRGYRDRLDALDLDAAERRRVVGESLRAYAHNSDLLADLGQEFPTAA